MEEHKSYRRSRGVEVVHREDIEAYRSREIDTC